MMKNLAPDIVRQRLLIEGLYSVEVSPELINSYLHGLAGHLSLRVYGDPIIHSPEGIGKEGNEGFDAFIPLIDSGISLYVWTSARFFAVVIFTCKAFDTSEAIAYSRAFFNAEQIEFKCF